MKKVILLGANGQLGSDILRTRPQNWQVEGWRRSDLDLGEIDTIYPAITGAAPDFVINTAAYHRTGECEDKAEKAFRLNGTAVREIAKACREVEAALVHLSTDYVFDGSQNRPYLERDRPNPLSTYGISKYTGELFAQNFCPSHYIIRVASLFGKEGSSVKGGGNFVFMVLDRATEGKELKIVNDITMSPTYTWDLAREIWRLVREDSPFGVYHITNGGHCTWLEFAKKILEAAQLKREIKAVSHREFPSKINRPLYSALASEKGIEMRSWQEATEDFVGHLMATRYS